MDPSRTDRVRVRFFEVLKTLDPLDARVLACLPGRGGGVNQGQRNENELSISRDEVDVSLENLVKVELASDPHGSLIALTALGRELLRAVAD